MSTLQFIQTTPEQLVDLINEGVKKQLENFKAELNRKQDSDDLLTIEQTCQLLKIDPSTLWRWTNKEKVKAYSISGKRYYKRNELMQSLTILKK